jgi:hypothetical protein
LKKIVIGVILTATFALSSAAAVRVGLAGGYARAFTASYGEGVAYGVDVAVDIFPFLAIGVRVTRIELRGDGMTDGLSKGRLLSMPVEADIQARLPVGSIVTPYLIVGAGYAWNSFRPDSGLSGSWNDVGFSISESVKNGPVALAGVGLDFAVRRWLVVSIEGRVVFVNATNGTWTINDLATGAKVSGTLRGLRWNSALAGISLKWMF